MSNELTIGLELYIVESSNAIFGFCSVCLFLSTKERDCLFRYFLIKRLIFFFTIHACTRFFAAHLSSGADQMAFDRSTAGMLWEQKTAEAATVERRSKHLAYQFIYIYCILRNVSCLKGNRSISSWHRMITNERRRTRKKNWEMFQKMSPRRFATK